ncbi:TPA: helix-turn-helix domain-containing protein [Vibrio harveyi]
MNEKKIATRLKKAILERGGYEKVSELTNLSVSTLKRCANGQTEPKFSTVAKIAEVTRKNIGFIAYGIGDEDSIVTAEGESRLKSEMEELKNSNTTNRKEIEDLRSRVKQIETLLKGSMIYKNGMLLDPKRHIDQ